MDSEFWKPRAQKHRRIYCNDCEMKTNHFASGGHRRVISLAENQFETTISALWVCAGCEAGTLEVSWTESGMRQRGRILYSTALHPVRREEHCKIKLLVGVPRKIDVLYKESIGAFNSGFCILCAAGLRGLVEAICADRGVPGVNLERKIEGLAALLPTSIVKNLHRFRFMGNRAMHELAAPDQETLRLSIEVVEDLLTFFFELPHKTGFLPKGRKQSRRSKPPG